MKCLYLGVEVEVAETPEAMEIDYLAFYARFAAARSPGGPGWCLARWPDGKVYRHWREQLKEVPNGA